MAVTRKARVPIAEQIRLINECRKSGSRANPSTELWPF